MYDTGNLWNQNRLELNDEKWNVGIKKLMCKEAEQVIVERFHN